MKLLVFAFLVIKAHESNTNKHEKIEKYKYEAGRDVVAEGVKDDRELQVI